jgi:hypothetical protein
VTNLTEVKANRFKQTITRLVNRLFNDRSIPWWPVIATLFVQFEVLFNGFLFDDYMHLYDLSNIPFLDALLKANEHLLYSFKTVMWLVKSLFGANPFAFMLLGLIIHLASVRLLFEIISRLTGKDNLAAFGAALWGMCPYAVGTLGWVSVHGQAYATAAILWVLLDVVRYSKTPSVLSNGLLIRHAFLLIVAATSFGAGLSSTVVFPFVVALWNPLPTQRNRLIAVYGSVALAMIALYLLVLAEPGEGIDKRSIVLWRGFGGISKSLGAFAELLSIGFSALIFGPLIVGKISLVQEESLSSVAPMIALFTALPLLVLGCVVSGINECRRVFAFLILPCAAYGLIAYARSGGWLAIHTEAYRYHYLAPAILAIILCLILSSLFDRLPERLLSYGRASLVTWLALVILPFHLGPLTAVKEPQLLRQTKQHKDSMRTIETALEKSTDQTKIYITNKPFMLYWGRYTPQHFPGLAALFVMSYPSNTVDGKQVYFLEESEHIVLMAQAQKGSRISELLIQVPKVSQ